MSRVRWSTVAQSAAFVGFVGSFFLFGEYGLPPSAGGCPMGGGCHTVRACHLLVPSITWPVLGTAGFLALLTLSLSSRPWARRLLRYVATLGLLVAVGLIFAQPLVCGAVCPYCLVTDTAAIAVAVASWLDRGEPVLARRRWGLGLATLVLGAGLLWRYNWLSDAKNEPTHLSQLPSVLRDQRPGVVTIVEFMDFTCSHCRSQHPELMQAIAPYGAKVRLLRRFIRSSPESENMARTQYCAEAQGKTHEMIDLLVESPAGTRESCESYAARLELDMAAFRKCLDDPATTARLKEDQAMAAEAPVFLLPTLFVGHDRFDGEATVATLRQAIDRALLSAR